MGYEAEIKFWVNAPLEVRHALGLEHVLADEMPSWNAFSTKARKISESASERWMVTDTHFRKNKDFDKKEADRRFGGSYELPSDSSVSGTLVLGEMGLPVLAAPGRPLRKECEGLVSLLHEYSWARGREEKLYKVRVREGVRTGKVLFKEEVYLTAKKIVSNSGGAKLEEEYEFRVKSADDAAIFLRKCGLQLELGKIKPKNQDKFEFTYQDVKAIIEINRLPLLGGATFLEIELFSHSRIGNYSEALHSLAKRMGVASPAEYAEERGYVKLQRLAAEK